MKASVFTWEYPPAIYGGAGVHAKYITTALAKRIKVEVRTLDIGPKPEIEGVNVLRYQSTLRGLATGDPRILKALQVLSFNMNMVADPIDAAIVHTHTWYTNFAGAMGKRIYGAKIEADLRSAIKSRNDVVWIRDMLEDHDLVNLYNEAAVFACPSVYEPFGIINLEAMACETPVVATRVGGIKEVVVNEETGLLVPPGEPAKLGRAITRILEDPQTGAKMGKAGRRHVLRNFTWDRIAARTLELYRSLT